MTANQQTRKRGLDPSYPRLLGDRLCLDFANTIEGPHSAKPEDFLRDYTDLARWGYHAGVLSEAASAQLLQLAEASPKAAATTFARGRALRTAITRVFHAIATGTAPRPSDLALLQSEYRSAMRHGQLLQRDDQYAWDWPDEGTALEQPLWPIARSAIDLLTQDNLARVKECPGAGDCGWLFYDTSKNGSRRWCSMEGCGSRLKMRRQYARKKGEDGSRVS
jgi:predicted RNA-binding Zn ribbon-like protein